MSSVIDGIRQVQCLAVADPAVSCFRSGGRQWRNSGHQNGYGSSGRWWGNHLHKAQAEESLWLCWFIVFFHCFIAWYLCCPPALCDTFPTSMAWYSLFVLKVS